MRSLFLFITLLALLTQPAAAQPIRAVRFGTATYTHPFFVTAPPGDTSRIFVLDQSGVIWIMNAATGVRNTTPFLTVPNVLYLGEGGLLGLAFHPDYANNGFFYIYYSKQNQAGILPEGRM